ncbi:hypothetical protein CKO44_23550 [Rubrivivax gelatinosus]|nr:hypothetical protein [Rubrivivax gelatinosus]MBZ8142807.1 hypothetical protein [Rubrivivax gelatinosus]
MASGEVMDSVRRLRASTGGFCGVDRMNWRVHGPRAARWLLLAAGAAMLVACGEDEKTAVSYQAYNHTDRSIINIIINGEGGILNAPAHDGGGEMCCVVIPNEWRPGLKATIKWRESGDFKRDERGQIVRVDGVPVVIERPYKEATVEIPKYGKPLGRFRIHFLPAGEVRAVVSLYGPTHRDYPIPLTNEPATPARAQQ